MIESTIAIVYQIQKSRECRYIQQLPNPTAKYFSAKLGCKISDDALSLLEKLRMTKEISVNDEVAALKELGQIISILSQNELHSERVVTLESTLAIIDIIVPVNSHQLSLIRATKQSIYDIKERLASNYIHVSFKACD